MRHGVRGGVHPRHPWHHRHHAWSKHGVERHWHRHSLEALQVHTRHHSVDRVHISMVTLVPTLPLLLFRIGETNGEGTVASLHRMTAVQVRNRLVRPVAVLESDETATFARPVLLAYEGHLNNAPERFEYGAKVLLGGGKGYLTDEQFRLLLPVNLALCKSDLHRCPHTLDRVLPVQPVDGGLCLLPGVVNHEGSAGAHARALVRHDVQFLNGAVWCHQGSDHVLRHVPRQLPNEELPSPTGGEGSGGLARVPVSLGRPLLAAALLLVRRHHRGRATGEKREITILHGRRRQRRRGLVPALGLAVVPRTGCGGRSSLGHETRGSWPEPRCVSSAPARGHAAAAAATATTTTTAAAFSGALRVANLERVRLGWDRVLPVKRLNCVIRCAGLAESHPGTAFAPVGDFVPHYLYLEDLPKLPEDRIQLVLATYRGHLSHEEFRTSVFACHVSVCQFVSLPLSRKKNTRIFIFGACCVSLV
eukprot:Hpha_TRINITY_DN15717_c1_g4::TRINITY_DN15717_c1_g4_i2::g.36580::m.36580